MYIRFLQHVDLTKQKKQTNKTKKLVARYKTALKHGGAALDADGFCTTGQENVTDEEKIV